VIAHRERNPQSQIMINGHREIAYNKVVQLMNLLQTQAGVESVGLMTEPEG